MTANLTGLRSIVTALRHNCPWFQKQTFSTWTKYVREESSEVIAAVQSRDAGQMRDELGDLLFQVVVLAGMAEEAGWFDMDDVVASIEAKMTRRNPHVFGGRKVGSDADVRAMWGEIKAIEKREWSGRNQTCPSCGAKRENGAHSTACSVAATLYPGYAIAQERAAHIRA